MTASVVGRLAPSPTGAQHLGNARTYLIAWLHARCQGGRVLLRIEDIDSPRVKPGAMAQTLADLAWLGLDWDGPVVVQSSRTPLYEQARQVLQDAELIYPCTCTRSDIEQAASAPHLEHEGPVYPGTCASRVAAAAGELQAEGRAFSWRFRVPASSPRFCDGFRGPCAIDLRQVGGDFVIWKVGRGSEASPAYQLAVVVDDADQGVTEVIRGDDLVASTPRQLLLYQALGRSPPQFVHVPLVTGGDGRRLAKRHGDTRLSTLREAGISPELVRGLLAWSCGWVEQIRPMAITELLQRFRLETIPREPFVFTPALLGGIGAQ